MLTLLAYTEHRYETTTEVSMSMESKLLCLPLDIREQIYCQVLLAPKDLKNLEEEQPLISRTGPQPQSLEFVVHKVLDNWDHFQSTIKVPPPSSFVLQLCCRQINLEISSLLGSASFASQCSTYCLGINMDNGFPHIAWKCLPAPVRYLRRLHVDLALHGWGLCVDNDLHDVTRDYHVLVRLLTAFIRSGPWFCAIPVLAPVPFLEEIDITFSERRAGESRTGNWADLLYKKMHDFVPVLTGLVGKISVHWKGDDGTMQGVTCRSTTKLSSRDHLRRAYSSVRIFENQGLLFNWDKTIDAIMPRFGKHGIEMLKERLGREKTALMMKVQLALDPRWLVVETRRLGPECEERNEKETRRRRLEYLRRIAERLKIREAWIMERVDDFTRCSDLHPRVELLGRL